MLRRDPTRIHLVADDIKDIGRGMDFGIIEDSNQIDSKINGKLDTDNQNWDSSIDESYLGSRSRERNLKNNNDTYTGANTHNLESTHEQVNNSLLRKFDDNDVQLNLQQQQQQQQQLLSNTEEFSNH